MKIFVIGDIHGAAKALDQCLHRANFDMDNDVLIQLGDVVDRHEEVFECVEILLQVKNLIAIKGNHDDWFYAFMSQGIHPRNWTYGGLGTIKSYLKHAGKAGMFSENGEGYTTDLVSPDIPATHRAFFARQRPFYIDQRNRCFVHGGFSPQIPLNEQRSEDFYWDRLLWQNAFQHKLMFGDEENPGDIGIIPTFREVYLGHTPTTNWDSDKPLHAFNIWNIDTGAGHSGRLTIMDVDSKEYWQSDPMPTLYAGNSR